MNFMPYLRRDARCDWQISDREWFFFFFLLPFSYLLSIFFLNFLSSRRLPHLVYNKQQKIITFLPFFCHFNRLSTCNLRLIISLKLFSKTKTFGGSNHCIIKIPLNPWIIDLIKCGKKWVRIFPINFFSALIVLFTLFSPTWTLDNNNIFFFWRSRI